MRLVAALVGERKSSDRDELALAAAVAAADAQVAAIVVEGKVVATFGYPRDQPPHEAIAKAATGVRAVMPVPGKGERRPLILPLQGRDGVILVARVREEYTLDQRRAVSNILELLQPPENAEAYGATSRGSVLGSLLESVVTTARSLFGADAAAIRVDGIDPELTITGEMTEAGMAVLAAPLGDVGAGQGDPHLATTIISDGGAVFGRIVVAGVVDREAASPVLTALGDHAALAIMETQNAAVLESALGEANRRADRDGLTGLPNRALVVDRLDHALLRADRTEGDVGVLFADLDRFKLVNDTLGHETGDRLLLEVATRLSRSIRLGDTVGRLGGDEFVAICEDVTPEALYTIAQRFSEAIAEPVWIDGREIVCSASVGMALAGPGARAQQLLRDADQAMYRAKEQGRSRIEVFDDNLRARTLQRAETETALRLAVKKHQLVLHYQPIIGLSGEGVVSVEALVRWQHPQRGLVPPGDFLPLAEETGLIVSIGEWVVGEACRQLMAWRLEHPTLRHLHMGVNLSSRQLVEDGFVENLTNVIAATGIEGESISLEITESALLKDGPLAVSTLEAAHKLGPRLLIDDFGTGYSSLAYLRRYPFDALKIDPTFVRDLAGSPEDRAIVASVISMAHSLGMATIGEGVETAEQRAVLGELGCDMLQGYLISRALPADEIVAVLLDLVPADSSLLS